MPAALRWTGTAIGIAVLWSLSATAILVWLFGLWEAVGELPPWAVPFQWFVFALHYRGYHQVPENLAISAAGATILAAAALVQNTRRAPAPLHGKTGWLTDQEAEAGGFSFTARPRPDSVVIGARGHGPFRRYVGLPGEEHAALTAKTRSGKGVSFVVPNALNWGGSLVCFSVKRDVFEAAAGHRARKGDAVFVFDISDPRRRTHRWNPLGYARRGLPETHGDIHRAMWFLVPETKANNPFWDNAARKLATAVGVVLAETPDARLNVQAVLGAVQRPDWADHLTGLIQAARDAGRPYPVSAANVVLGIAARRDEKEARDVIQTLTTALGLWDDPVVASATEESDFDLAALRCEAMSVFVCGGPADIRIYRPVYGLLFQQLVQLNTRSEFGRDPRHRHRVLGILDEFWALGKQDVLADASAFTASYGFRWAYVQQSEEQSVAAFGKEGAANLFTNTGARLDFGGMDREAAEKISKWAGDNTVRARSRNRPKFMPWLFASRQTESESERPRPLVLPQEIQRLASDKLLVRRGNLHLFRLDRVLWFDDPWLKRLGWSADPEHKPLGPPPPEVLPLAVTVQREDLEALAAQRREAAERYRAAQRREATAEREKAEAGREAAERRLAELRAQAADASARAATAAGEAKRAAGASATAGMEAAAAKAKAKGGDEAATAEATRMAALAAEATEAARQAKQRASTAARDAQAAGKRLEAFTRAFRATYPV